MTVLPFYWKRGPDDPVAVVKHLDPIEDSFCRKGDFNIGSAGLRDRRSGSIGDGVCFGDHQAALVGLNPGHSDLSAQPGHRGNRIEYFDLNGIHADHVVVIIHALVKHPHDKSRFGVGVVKGKGALSICFGVRLILRKVSGFQ